MGETVAAGETPTDPEGVGEPLGAGDAEAGPVGDAAGDGEIRGVGLATETTDEPGVAEGACAGAVVRATTRTRNATTIKPTSTA